MLSSKMLEALNKQANYEFNSAFSYLSMHAYFESVNLTGFATWMQQQYQEELAHAHKFLAYIHGRQGRVVLDGIAKPKFDWTSIKSAIEEALQQEKKVTDAINNLVNLALQDKDHATNNFLQWFVSEQVEEESSIISILNKLELVGESKGSLYFLDREMKKARENSGDA